MDWKTVTKDNLSGASGNCQYPLEDYKGSKFNGYVIQMSLYAYILQKLYGLDVFDIKIVVFFKKGGHDERDVKPIDVPLVLGVWQNIQDTEKLMVEWYKSEEWSKPTLPRYPVPLFSE